jgi:alpha-L-fucosidase 2
MKKFYFLFGAVMLLLLNSCSEQSNKINSGEERMQCYNVVWNSPSKDASGVMSIGNGDIAAGVYAIENGDLYLLLAKNDAYTYMGDIFKTGRIRISLDPNPFKSGKPFIQTLDLPSGSVQIEADGVKLRIWADANHPVYHIEIKSPRKINIKARPEFWKRFDACVFNTTDYYTPSVLLQPPAEPTQDVKLERNGKLLWYFAVGDRSVYQDDLKFYNVEHMAEHFADPFRFNTFGNLLECTDLQLKEGEFSGTGKSCDIRIHALTMQTPNTGTWIEAIEQQAARPVNTEDDWKKHCTWWAEFWNRSWIIASDRTVPAEVRGKLNGETSQAGIREEKDGASLTAQSYNVFRFLMACQSRGKVQSKFNGGLFTQQLRLKPGDKSNRSGNLTRVNGDIFTHEDDRLWGRRFTYQNQRLLYWPLLASGDFDLMKPFISYYSNLLPVRQAITKAWFGHEGAYYRENIEPTGAERDCGMDGRPPRRQPGQPATFYHDYYFTSGLETLAMMTDYANFTENINFRDSMLVPFAREVLLFYNKHYSRGKDGKLRIDPVQVLETWWSAVNSSPDVSGLMFCLDELLAMKAGTPEDQLKWQKFRSEIPEVSLQTIDGKLAIAPAEKWDINRNAENGELYPVFPFRCFGLGLGSADIVDWTMKHRSFKDAFNYACWTQDQIHWAFAGNASECVKGLVQRFRNASSLCRFPLYGKEGPDSCPDLDHFGAGSTALQKMLVQETGEKILLLPAWPATWDVDFKLHLSGNAILTGTVKDGKLLKWEITPDTRKNDVVVYQPQSI